MTTIELRKKIIQQLETLDGDALAFLSQLLDLLKTGFQLQQTPPQPKQFAPPNNSSPTDIQETLSVWQKSGFIGCFSAEPDFAEQSKAILHGTRSFEPHIIDSKLNRFNNDVKINSNQKL